MDENFDEIAIEIPNNDSVFYSLIDSASNDKLESYINEIEEEKHMREYRKERYNKLKEEFRKEKLRMAREIKEAKNKKIEEMENDIDESFKKKKSSKRVI